jgi:hypothetical protein
MKACAIVVAEPSRRIRIRGEAPISSEGMGAEPGKP